jgi:hypothetical protein
MADPHRIIQMCDRISEVVEREFGDLEPDAVFMGLSAFAASYVEELNKNADRLRQNIAEIKSRLAPRPDGD